MEDRSRKGCKREIRHLLREIRSIESLFASFIRLDNEKIFYAPEVNGRILFYKDPSSNYRSFIDIDGFLRNEYSVLNNLFDQIVANRFFATLDHRIIELVNELQYSDFQYYLNLLSDYQADYNGKMIGVRSDADSFEAAFKKFLSLAKELEFESGSQIDNRVIYVLLEGNELDEYKAFIKQERCKEKSKHGRIRTCWETFCT